MAVPLDAAADDLALDDVEGGEQGGRAMPLVVMGHRAGAPLLHRQARLGPIQGLNLALLIDRQDDGMIGRITHGVRFAETPQSIRWPGVKAGTATWDSTRHEFQEQLFG